MKRNIFFLLISVLLLVIIIPSCTLFILKEKPEGGININIQGNKTINVFNHHTQKLMQMDLEEYLVGVVAGEMPASFELEALKAQAVAARTYAYKRIIEPDQRVKKLASNAHVVTDHTICQAWVSDQGLQERWGEQDYKKYKQKIAKAVQETRGIILLYENKPIDPVYHASCGGQKTEDSGEVWQSSYSYLKSVSCSGHQDKHHNFPTYLSFEQIKKVLNTQSVENINLLEKTSTGRIKSIKIGDIILTGPELRTKLDLKSTILNWRLEKEGLTFISTGYGHGVGMCQYGANDFATQGKNHLEILQHYYPGISFYNIYE